MRLFVSTGLFTLLFMLLWAAVLYAEETPDTEGQGAYAAPAAAEQSAEKTPDSEDGDVNEGAPQMTDFGAEDNGGKEEIPAADDDETKAEAPAEKQADTSAGPVGTEAQPEKTGDSAGEKKDFPKSPYPEMEGLSDRSFKLGSEDQNPEGEAKEEKKARRHTGFYLRLAPALAYISCKGEGKSSAEKLNNPKSQGVGGVLDVFVGGAVVEDWILHADLSVAAPFAGVKGVENRKQMSLIGIGLGFTHYFMPQNFYMSSNLTYAQTKMMKDGDGAVQSFDTANGFKVNAAFGKEWWVADQFGLGVSGMVFYSWSKKSVLTWNIYGGGAVFTLTYN